MICECSRRRRLLQSGCRVLNNPSSNNTDTQSADPHKTHHAQAAHHNHLILGFAHRKQWLQQAGLPPPHVMYPPHLNVPPMMSHPMHPANQPRPNLRPFMGGGNGGVDDMSELFAGVYTCDQFVCVCLLVCTCPNSLACWQARSTLLKRRAGRQACMQAYAHTYTHTLKTHCPQPRRHQHEQSSRHAWPAKWGRGLPSAAAASAAAQQQSRRRWPHATRRSCWGAWSGPYGCWHGWWCRQQCCEHGEGRLPAAHGWAWGCTASRVWSWGAGCDATTANGFTSSHACGHAAAPGHDADATGVCLSFFCFHFVGSRLLNLQSVFVNKERCA